MTLHDTPTSLGATSRRRFLRSLGLLVAGTSLIAACGPSTTTTPAAQPTSAPAPAAKPTSAPAAAPAQATPGGIGTQPISIEWWRRNYTPGSQNAETITSDAAVKAFRDRYPNVSITIQ